MYTIRDLLDFLADEDMDSIRRLCDIRDVGGRGKAAQCEALARSYRGNFAQLFEELLKQDLVRLLADPTKVDGSEYYLPSASRYAKNDLEEMALKLFQDEKVPKGFVSTDEESDDDDEQDDDEQDDDEQDDDDDEQDDDGEEEQDDDDDDGEEQDDDAIDIFISHAAKDAALAKSFVDCLEACLEVPDRAIRCTSVPGYKLAPGDVSDKVLRKNLKQCSVVIGLLTNNSLNSGYVLMELGAAWGRKKTTCALLAPNIEFGRMPGPLSRLHAIKADNDHDIASLMEAIADNANLSLRNRARFTAAVSTFVAAAKAYSRES
ncbi:MAG: toll/interleukin-1 receptor domain-containing protein [Minicystis sp.]